MADASLWLAFTITTAGRRMVGQRRCPPGCARGLAQFLVVPQSEIGLGALANEVGGDQSRRCLPKRRAWHSGMCSSRSTPAKCGGLGGGGTPSRLCGG